MNTLAFRFDGLLVASGSEDQTIRVWKMESEECLRMQPGRSHQINAVAFSPDGELLASGSDDTTICLWKAESEAISLGKSSGI